MRILALVLGLLFISPVEVQAQPRAFCKWNCSGVPVRPGYGYTVWPRHHAPVYRPKPRVYNPGVSTGAAVASAVAVGAVAGVIGYELGRRNSTNHSVDRTCKDVTIDNEQRTVCRDQKGNWVVQ